MAGGWGIGSLVKVFVKNMDVVVGPVVSLVYPLYASMRALETNKSNVGEEHRQWLTYWVISSMITSFEITFATLIEYCIPCVIWSYAKLILNCWLVIPYFSGSAYVYAHCVRPFFLNPQAIVNVLVRMFQRIINAFEQPLKSSSVGKSSSSRSGSAGKSSSSSISTVKKSRHECGGRVKKE